MTVDRIAAGRASEVFDLGGGRVLRALPAAAALRLADPNVGDDERRAVRRLLVRAGLPPP